jgi:hypothetical protein
MFRNERKKRNLQQSDREKRNLRGFYVARSIGREGSLCVSDVSDWRAAATAKKPGTHHQLTACEFLLGN